MPRVAVYKTKYMVNDLQDYIVGERKRQKKNQSYMGNLLSMSQQNYSIHEKEMSFDAGQLIEIFKDLGTDSEKIGRMMSI